MKILVVTQRFFPENWQVNEICEDLIANGNQVTVLTGLPHDSNGKIRNDYKKRKKRQEKIHNINIVRCFEIGRRNSLFFLILNYISFWISSLLKVSKLQNDYDIVFGYQLSPVTAMYAAKKYSKTYRKKLVIYTTDIWPESVKVYIKNENNLLYKITDRISKSIYSSSDLIVCSSKSFISYFIDIHKIDKDKLTYLPQFGDDELLNYDLYKKRNKIIELYFLGNVGKEQNLDNVISSIKNIDNVRLNIVGSGSNLEKLKKIVENNSKLREKVIFYGRKPKSKMIEYYKLADACIISLREKNRIGLTLPNKIMNYMAAGKPILGMISGSAKEIIEEANCGFCANGNDIEQFTTNINEFIRINNDKKYGENARNYYRKCFTRRVFYTNLEKILLEQINS